MILNLLFRNLMMPEVLQLKKGSQVMLITNLSKDLVNGSTGIVTPFNHQRFPVVTFDEGICFTVEPKTLADTDRNDTSKMVAQRTQLPLKLAWAITAHKSQGMTLPCVEVHCGNEFTSGQLYVSLSRAKESSGLSLVGFSKAKLIQPPKIVVDFYSAFERDDSIVLSEMCCNNARISTEVLSGINSTMICRINASVNSSCAHPPPPRATAGHLHTLSVPGIGH